MEPNIVSLWHVPDRQQSPDDETVMDRLEHQERLDDFNAELAEYDDDRD